MTSEGLRGPGKLVCIKTAKSCPSYAKADDNSAPTLKELLNSAPEIIIFSLHCSFHRASDSPGLLR